MAPSLDLSTDSEMPRLPWSPSPKSFQERQSDKGFFRRNQDSDRFAARGDCAATNLDLFGAGIKIGLCSRRKEKRVDSNQDSMRAHLSSGGIKLSCRLKVCVLIPLALTDTSDTRHNILIDCLELWLVSE